jgi:hypothetical protein
MSELQKTSQLIIVQVENDKILDVQDFIINLSVLITIMIIFGKKYFYITKSKTAVNLII